MHHIASSIHLLIIIIHHAFIIFIYVHWQLHHDRIRGDSFAGEQGEGEPVAEFLGSHGYYLNNLGEGKPRSILSLL